MQLKPDSSFYPTAKMAMAAPAEKYGFTVMLSGDHSEADGIAVVDLDPDSSTYGEIVHQVMATTPGDEFHHFGWNACSASLSPMSGHAFIERRYLVVPGIRSSRIYIIDVKEPLKAKIHKIIEPEEVFEKTGYSRPHTIHCGPEGIYVSTLGGAGEDGIDGPPGIFIMDCETFEILGRYEMDRGKQDKHYDFWWNLPQDYMVSSEWGLPPQFENGVVPADLLSNKYGHSIHVVDTTNLQGAIFTWWRGDDGVWQAKKTITIDPVPAEADDLPELLKGFGAVPPLVTDIDLSLDDRFLYVACWGLGEMHQYDVSDPMNPKLVGKVELGGIVKDTKHPNGKDFAYGPQMVEISRDGKRVYWTNSLYSTWDDQFYPNDEGGQMVMARVGDEGGLTLDKDFYIDFPKGLRAHQIRLEGGDCSTDSFCYPNT